MSATGTAPSMSPRLSFVLPRELEATEPAEARGAARDGVRMLVAARSTGELTHSTCADLPHFLHAGDLVVINTSAVIPAAIEGTAAGRQLAIHLSTHLSESAGRGEPDRWVVEPRHIVGNTTMRWGCDTVPRAIELGPDASLQLVEPYLGSDRLWVAELRLPAPTLDWLNANGQPIRYSYVEQPWPLSAYQNVYSIEPGSAEMPSAGRPFTAELITRLVSQGVDITPIVLHTGVASLESDELPYPERVHVPAATAARVNLARANGGRIIAVGTTAVRALESAAGCNGEVHELDGWTDLVITPERSVCVVDGLITGWHEPEASHLLMLEAISGRPLLEASYAASIAGGYRWHEFGDIHLIVP